MSASARLGWPMRILLVLVGGLMALAGAGSLGLLLVLVVRSGRLVGGEWTGAAAVALLAVVAFGGLAWMGVARIVRGVRGYTPATPPSGRLEIWLRHNGYAVGLAIWAALALAAERSAPNTRDFLLGPNATVRLPWFAFLFVLVLPLHVAVHELGHAAAGALVGFRFQSLRVGWLAIRRTDQGMRVSWSRPEVLDVLGFHVALPVDEERLGLRLALHAAAGPCATLGAALLCAAGSRAIGHPGTIGQALAENLLWAGFLAGTFLGVLNLVPFRTRSGLNSDGANLARTLRPERPCRAAARRFVTQWALGRRPRDWGMSSSDLLSLAPAAGADRASLLLAAAAVAVDNGDDQGAIVILRDALAADSHGAQWRTELELQLVMLEAFNGRVADARRLLEGLVPNPALADYACLAHGTVRAAEGVLDEARELRDRWERSIQATGQAASVRVGNEWAIERLNERLRTGTTSGLSGDR